MEQGIKERPKGVIRNPAVTKNNNGISIDHSSVGNKALNELRMAQRLDVQVNRIVFDFPMGFTQIPIIEDIRLLEVDNTPEYFDVLYDIVMQKLTGKGVNIYLRDNKGEKHLVCSFVVTNREMNLHGVDFLDKYPIVVSWMVQGIRKYELKKFPLPSSDWEEKAAKTKKKREKTSN